MKCLWAIATALASLLCFAASGAPVRLLLLSDVHYDPAYGSSNAFGVCTEPQASVWGSSDCDSPLHLITSALEDAASQAPDLLLMSGDWLRHEFSLLPLSEATPTFRTVAELLSHVIPNNSSAVFSVPNFQGAIGNNDFVPDYYFDVSNPAHPLLQNQSDALKSLNLLSAAESVTFGKCGYYARTVSRRATNNSSGLRIVVLNTIMYSVLLDPPLAASVADPCGQFAFLNQTLENASITGDKVILVAHIPPGMNLYGVLSMGGNTGLQSRQFWNEKFVSSFRAILFAYRHVVMFQFYGHTHMFSVLADAELGVPGMIVPSITRVFGNMPSYLVAEIDDETWKISDVRQRYLQLNAATGAATWVTASTTIGSIFSPDTEGAGGDVFAPDNVSMLADGCRLLATNDSLWAEFQKVHEGGTILDLFPTPPGSSPLPIKGACNEACKQIVLCSMLHTRWADVAACLAAPPPTAPPSPPSQPTTPAPPPNGDGSVAGGYIALYVMCAVLGVGAVAVVGRRCCPRIERSKAPAISEGSGLIPSPPRRELDSISGDVAV